MPLPGSTVPSPELLFYMALQRTYPTLSSSDIKTPNLCPLGTSGPLHAWQKHPQYAVEETFPVVGVPQTFPWF